MSTERYLDKKSKLPAGRIKQLSSQSRHNKKDVYFFFFFWLGQAQRNYIDLSVWLFTVSPTMQGHSIHRMGQTRKYVLDTFSIHNIHLESCNLLCTVDGFIAKEQSLTLLMSLIKHW